VFGDLVIQQSTSQSLSRSGRFPKSYSVGNRLGRIQQDFGATISVGELQFLTVTARRRDRLIPIIHANRISGCFFYAGGHESVTTRRRRLVRYEPACGSERSTMNACAKTFASPSGQPSTTRPMPQQMCEKIWTLSDWIQRSLRAPRTRRVGSLLNWINWGVVEVPPLLLLGAGWRKLSKLTSGGGGSTLPGWVVKPIIRPINMILIHTVSDRIATALPARGADRALSQR